jgi:hypothetical protein
MTYIDENGNEHVIFLQGMLSKMITVLTVYCFGSRPSLLLS